MDTRVAAAWKAGAPLTIEEVEIALAKIREDAPFDKVCYIGCGARGRTDAPKIVDGYTDGKINIDDLITHTLKPGQINEGFDLMNRGESIRSVVVY